MFASTKPPWGLADTTRSTRHGSPAAAKSGAHQEASGEQGSVERKTPHNVLQGQLASPRRALLAALSTGLLRSSGLLFITITYSFPTLLDFLIKKVKDAS